MTLRLAKLVWAMTLALISPIHKSMNEPREPLLLTFLLALRHHCFYVSSLSRDMTPIARVETTDLGDGDNLA